MEGQNGIGMVVVSRGCVSWLGTGWGILGEVAGVNVEM